MRTASFKQGKRADLASIPFDPAHLETQVPGLRGTANHAAHYLTRGVEDRLDPTPFFLTDWYAWQNPDWSDGFSAPYLHYLEIGQGEGRDPSPFVDVTRFVEVTGGAVPLPRVYSSILAGFRSPALGVCESPEDLVRAQSDFVAGLAVFAHRVTPSHSTRPSLVVCQAGRGAMFDNWAGASERTWDLLVNYYDAAGFRPGLGDYAVFQKGTKFTAMNALLRRFPDLFDRYRHVLFLDDDVETTATDLNDLFSACDRYGLDLAQMSLTEGSACNWKHLFRRFGQAGPRDVSAVEIMMPVLSRRALGWIAPTLGRSVSGFGLDLVWGNIVARKGGRIAVLDEVAATHARALDQTGGAFYRYLRRHGINPKAELWTLLTETGSDRDMVST